MDPIRVLSRERDLNSDIIDEICRGAHVIVKDSGALYSEWHAKGKERIWSEHHSSRSVFDVQATTGNVLIGTTEDGHTWLQWERSANCTCVHCRDWFRYFYSGKNQGPEGESLHTELSPLILARDIEF